MLASDFYDIDGYCWLARLAGHGHSGLAQGLQPFDTLTWIMLGISFVGASTSVALLLGGGRSAYLDIFGSIVNQTRMLSTVARYS